MEPHSFGHWLRLKRKALDLTREELAERVGYSAATIRKIEDEERHPSAQIVERLAEIFNIPQNERAAFLGFARGDWKSAPTGSVENPPWLASQTGKQIELSNPKIHLATFLFTDIEGSAKLWEHAQEKMKIALQRHHEILQKAISDNGGTVFQIIGDAFCAAFSTVLSAVHAAVAAQQELQGEPWDLPFPIRVRMGIHTGEAERTANDNYASGPTLNRVARILSAAYGGQILLSLATKDLVKDSLPANTELRDMGEHYLRNLMYPEHLFQLNIAGLPEDFPPLKTLTHHHNLPVQVTSFIAREREISLIRQYLARDDIRLVTLMGPPGIGKTRLSIEAARASLQDFPDGVFFVALALLDDPKSIASAIIQALGYMESGDNAPEDQLKESIGHKQMLIVLDNCEHLIEKIASIASGLLAACPRLKMLATSRESFRIPGEWLYPLPPFGIPEESDTINLDNAADFPALTLFVERARAVRPDFKLTADNVQTIATICAHLDGLPLVIELIAARMRLMSPRALLERMSAQFVLTADGMRAPSERQKTLRNAIAWSYNLLSAEEQKLFVYLSVFSGGFTLDDAEMIFARAVTGKSVPQLLSLLLDKSLIRRVANESSEDRYEILVTIQEYARERLGQLGEETEIRNWHLTYFLGLAEKADKELYGHNQLEWLNRLRARRNNLHAALDWAIETKQTKLALQMVRKLDWFWHLCSDHVEAAQSLLRVLELPDVSSYPEAHAEVLAQLQHHNHLLGDHFAAQIQKGEVMSYAEQALAIARAHNDTHNSARALAMIGLNLATEKNFAEAQPVLEESKTLFQQVQDEWGAAYVFFLLGWKSFRQNDLEPALLIVEQAYAIFEKLGERYFMCVSLRYIGITQIRLGNIKQGVEALRDSLTTAQQLGSKYEIAAAFYRLGQAAQYLGSPTRTVSLFWAAKNAHDAIGMGVWTQGLAEEFDTVLERCRAALGEAEFEEAVEKGRAMTMEQAIAYALEDSHE